MLELLALLAGVLLLWKGGDLLVEGADRFARGKGMPSSLAGVFILGFATSAPELVTTVFAAISGHPGIASGNVIGSNIANVGLILGTAAFITVVVVDRFILRVDVPLVIGISVLTFLLFREGSFDRTDGLIFLGLFALYTLYSVLTAGKRPAPTTHPEVHRPFLELGMAALGLSGLLLGAHFFLLGAIAAAHWLGVSDTVIGLSLVALGTSLPELATTIAAARTNRMELAVGNVVGSNLFNLLLVLGVAGVLNPQPADARLLEIDLPVMIGMAVACLVLPLLGGGRMRRWHGVLLLAGYFAYIAVIAATAG